MVHLTEQSEELAWHDPEVQVANCTVVSIFHRPPDTSKAKASGRRD